MLIIIAVLHENQPRFGTTCRSGIDGSLQRRVVTRTVLCHNGIIETRLWLDAFHGSEGKLSGGYRFAAARGQYALRHGKGVACVIFQSAVSEDGSLATDNRHDLLTIEGCSTRASLNLIVEGEDDGATGTHSGSTIGWIAGLQYGQHVRRAHRFSKHKDIGEHGAVVGTLHAYLGRFIVGHETDIHTFLVAGLCWKLKLSVSPASVGQLVSSKRGVVDSINTVFGMDDAVGIIVIAHSSRELQVLIALGREGYLEIPVVGNGAPYADAIATLHFALCHSIGKPAGGLAFGIAQRQHTRIFRIGGIVSRTVILRCI